MAQSDVFGLRKAVTKQVDLTIEQYDGTAKDGELLIDMNPGNTQYMIFVGMEDGYVTDLIANNAVNANNANFAGNVTIANQPNITTVGTLTDLAVAGNAVIGGNVGISGNLNVDGDITYINITDLQIEDPIILLGGGANGAPLTANDGKDRGTQLQVFDTGAGTTVPKFMGWKNSAGEFVLGSNVTNAVDVITVNTYGNLRLDTVLGSNIVMTGNIDGFDLNASNTVAATVDVTAGNDVTAVMDVSAGNDVTAGSNIIAGLEVIAGGNISATGNITSSANISALLDVNAGGNVAATGNVTGSNLTATLDISAGGNIAATGNITATANVAGGNLTTGGEVVATGNVVSSANVDGVNFNASGNMVATGNITATANVAGGNITTGGQVVATGNVVSSANVDGVNFNASGILSVTGNVSGGNLTTGGQVVATGNVVSSANVDGVNFNASGNIAATGNITATANVAGGNITTGGQVVATGNLVSSANVDGVNFNASGNVVATGNITATANVAGGNITTGGQVVATGNLVSSANVNGVNFNASGNMVATGNVSGQNIAATANLSSANLTVAVGNVDFTTTANVSLGAVANLHISGGTSGQVLRTDGAGVLSWVDANTAPGGAGANTQVIFNDAGVMGAVSTFTYDKATDILAVGNVSLTANLSVGGEVLTHLIPNGNKVYDLGNATNRWGNIYLSNNSLYLGAVHVTSDDVGIVNIPNVATANMSATGNVSGGNLTTGGEVVATGNVSGGNLTTAGGVFALDATVTDLYVNANASITGNITVGNIVTTGSNVDFTTATQFNLGSNIFVLPSETTLQADVFASRADTAATATLDCGTADYFKYTVTGITTFTATNVPAAGRVCSIIVEIVNGGSASVTYFGGTKWAAATPPTLTAAGTDVLGFYTVDGGSSWVGLVLGLNIS